MISLYQTTSNEDNSEDPDEEEEDDATWHNCVSCGPDEEFQDLEDRVEQDVLTCFLAAGAIVEDREHANELSKAVHDELFAFYARQTAHGLSLIHI